MTLYIVLHVSVTWGCMSMKIKDEQVQEEGLVRSSTYTQHQLEAQRETEVHTHVDNTGGTIWGK